MQPRNKHLKPNLTRLGSDEPLEATLEIWVHGATCVNKKNSHKKYTVFLYV